MAVNKAEEPSLLVLKSSSLFGTRTIFILEKELMYQQNRLSILISKSSSDGALNFEHDK